MRRRIIGGLVAAAALVLLILALRPRPVPVDAAVVDRGPLQATVDEDGRTRVIYRYVLTAPIAGQLARIALNAGDAVLAGQVVARLDPTPPPLLDPRARAELTARLRAAEAAERQRAAGLDAARAARDFADKDLARMEKLKESGALSAQGLDAARLRARTAREDLEAAQFALKVASNEAEATRSVLARLSGGGGEQLAVIAPASGEVLRVFQQSAGVVGPGAPLVEIGDPSQLEVLVDVLTEDAVAIPPSARVEIRRWGGPGPLAGRVRRVEPSAFTKISALGVEEQRVNAVIELLDPPDARPGLGDGFRVEAAIVTWESPDVTRVPAGALFRRGDSWAAFAIAGGRAELRTVRIGHRGGLTVEVLSGLSPGDSVVLYPSDSVADGVRVKAR